MFQTAEVSQTWSYGMWCFALLGFSHWRNISSFCLHCSLLKRKIYILCYCSVKRCNLFLVLQEVIVERSPWVSEETLDFESVRLRLCGPLKLDQMHFALQYGYNSGSQEVECSGLNENARTGSFTCMAGPQQMNCLEGLEGVVCPTGVDVLLGWALRHPSPCPSPCLSQYFSFCLLLADQEVKLSAAVPALCLSAAYLTDDRLTLGN